MNVRKEINSPTTSKRMNPVSWPGGEAKWSLPMNRHFVASRLSLADHLWFPRMSRANPAIFQDEDISTPVDPAAGKTCEPHPESDQIAQRHKPEPADDGRIVYDTRS